MIIIVLVTLGMLASLHISVRYGLRNGLALILFYTATLIPLRLLGGDVQHAGVADATPALYSYSVVLMAAVAVALFAERKPTLWSPVVLVLLMPVWSVLVWASDDLLIAGIAHYVSAAAVWIAVQPLAAWKDERRDSIVSLTILTVVAVEAGIALAQALGLVVPFFGGALVAGGFARVTGTFGHPGTLGKAMVLLLMLTLPQTKSVSAYARRNSWWSVGMIVIVTGLTVGRANLIALATTLLLWLLLDRSRNVSSRVRGVLASSILLLPFVEPFLGRIDDDPTGGARPELTAEAWAYLAESLWIGTGPNRYVEVVGAYRPATGAGFPVHNSLLLVVAELGVVLAIVFLWPYARATVSAIGQILPGRQQNPYSLAILAGTPGTIVTLLTGWGMVGDPILILWTFVYAFLYAASRSRETSYPDVNEGARYKRPGHPYPVVKPRSDS